MHVRAEANVRDLIPRVQIQRHGHIVQRSIGRNWHTEAFRKFNRQPPRREGEQAPVEVRFSAKLIIVLIGQGPVLSEGEVGMAEKFLGDRRLLCRIDDLCFQASDPLHPGFLYAAEFNSPLN